MVKIYSGPFVMPKLSQVAVFAALGVLSLSHAHHFSEIKALKQVRWTPSVGQPEGAVKL